MPKQELGQDRIWLKTADCVDLIPCKNAKSAREWILRHGIKRRSNGTVSRLDLERELARRKPKREMHPASIANLAKRHEHHSKAPAATTSVHLQTSSGLLPSGPNGDSAI